jgi:DNA end-binding protein Ku
MPTKKKAQALLEASASGRSAGRAQKRTLMLGPLAIPVEIFAAAREENIPLNLLHADCGHKVKQQYACPACVEVEVVTEFTDDRGVHPAGETFTMPRDSANALLLAQKIKLTDAQVIVDRDQMVKGFEISKGQYVHLTAKEIEDQKVLADDVVSIAQFVPVAQVNSLYLESSYYLAPDCTVDRRSFALLRKSMVAQGVAAVAKLTRSQRERLAFLVPYAKDGMLMHEAFLSDEIRTMDFSELPALEPAEEKLGIELVKEMTSALDMSQFADGYRENLVKLIEAKQAGKIPDVVIPAKAPIASAGLMDLVRAGIEVAKSKKKSA